VFKKHCVTCHNQDRARGDLDLSSFAGVKAGAASGAAVISGKAEESLIYALAAHLDTPHMPPNKPRIPQRDLDLIGNWIDGGLLERGETVKASSAATKPTDASGALRASDSASVTTNGNPGVPIKPLRRATPITALAVSPTVPLMAVSGHKQVALFNLTDRAPLAAFPFPEGDVFALRLSRDGEVLVAGGGVGGLSGKVVGFEVSTGNRLFEFGDESDAVLALDISPDGTLVALGGPGRSVKVFRVADGELAATLRKHTDWIFSIAFSPDGLLLATGDRFGALMVWEAGTGKEFLTLRGHVGAVNDLAWSSDSNRLLSAGQDGTLRFWDMHQGESVSQWNGGVGGILSVDSDGADRVVCGGRDRKLALWDKPAGNVREITMPDEVTKVGVSQNSSQVVAADAAGNIAVYSLEDGTLAGNLILPRTTEPARGVAATKSPPRMEAAATGNLPALASELAAAEERARKLTAESAEIRESLALAEAAVKTADEAMKKLRDSAARLKSVAAGRDAAAREAAREAARLRAQVEAAGMKSGDTPIEPAAERERISRRLEEKRSILESATALAGRIKIAAARDPHDTGIDAAAKLIDQLQSRLARDVEAATSELRRLEGAAETVRK
jgi:hypothetical protein